MSQIKRVWFAMKVTMVNALAAIVYFRIVIDKLQPLVTGQFRGTYTAQAELAIYVVPIAFGIIVVATWMWVLISPQQEETARSQMRRPR